MIKNKIIHGKNVHWRWPIIICVINTIIWTGLLSYKYYRLGYHDWDLAFFSQSMFQLTKGLQFSSLVGINFLGDHSYYFSLFFVPLFKLFPHPLTLLVLKVFSYSLAGFLIYKIAIIRLGFGMSIFLLLLYFIFPPNIFSMLYEFNPENLAAPLFLLSFLFFQKRDFLKFIITALLLMLVKENMALIVVAFGIYAFMDKKRPALIWGFCPVLLGSVFFLIVVLYLIPLYRGLDTHAFIVRYNHLGNSFSEIIFNIINCPDLFFKAIFNSRNCVYIIDSFGPLIFFSFLGAKELLLSFPLFLQHLLSSNILERTIFYHYSLTLTPFIFISAISTFSQISKKRFKNMLIGIMIALFIFNGINIYKFREIMASFLNPYPKCPIAESMTFVNQIPQDEGVITTFVFLAPLSIRDSLYSFHKIFTDSFQDLDEMKKNELNIKKVFILPDNVSYAVIDFRDYVIMRQILDPESCIITKERIKNFFEKYSWTVIGNAGTVFFFKRAKGQSVRFRGDDAEKILSLTYPNLFD